MSYILNAGGKSPCRNGQSSSATPSPTGAQPDRLRGGRASGKTAVLVERIVQLVREGCPIENMLVVTFLPTRRRAKMRQRIGEALGKGRAGGSSAGRTSDGALPREHLHAAQVLRQPAARDTFRRSIDPGFRIGDEQECGVLSRQAMEDAIYSCYEVGSDAFLAADRCYAQGGIERIGVRAASVYDDAPRSVGVSLRARRRRCALTGERLNKAPPRGLLADFAGRAGWSASAPTRGRRWRSARENGPLHYAAACGMDVQLTADLAAAAADGYAALHDALHGVTFAALGRKKKTDLFDEGYRRPGEGAARRAQKKAVADVQTAFALTLEDAAADISA